MADILEFYSRKDIQKAIVNASQNREFSAVYGLGNFGKRPDMVSFENDIFELAKQGATSFHISEEHWSNSLLLKPGMTQPQLDKLRIGWDLILDIDTKFIDYAKTTASLLIKALQFHNIKNIGLKFSGGSGIHLGVPFSSLPKEVNGKDIKLLFPEAPRAIAAHLKDIVQSQLKEKILDISTLQEISKAVNKPQEELLENEEFNPFSIIEIDTILISNRHMYRAPYSLNEKKGLISVPISIENLPSFNLKKARIENVKTTTSFLPKTTEKEASELVIQAFDTVNKKPSLVQIPEEIKTSKIYEELKTAIPTKFFPSCINQILKGVKEDGRKRALFILINFLKSVGYPVTEVEKIVLDWNNKNYQALHAGYIQSQLNWHKRQIDKVLPPNCDNDSYYKNMGIKCIDCTNTKNPVNFSKRKFFAHQKHKPKKRKTKSS